MTIFFPQEISAPPFIIIFLIPFPLFLDSFSHLLNCMISIMDSVEPFVHFDQGDLALKLNYIIKSILQWHVSIFS